MDSIKALLLNSPKQDILLGVVMFQAVCAIPFMICSFVVSGTANAGFNCVLTSFLNLAYIAGAFYVVRNSKAPIAYGFVIGSGSMLLVLNLMTAVYWGQLSHCTRTSSSVAQYSCDNTTAYGAVAAFSSLLFISQSALVSVIVFWRAELLQEAGQYVGVAREEDVATVNFHSATSSFGSMPPSRQQADF